MKIAIFAAGTGGHIYPALSIAKEFGKENVIFIASNRELEKKIYRDSGFEVKHLNEGVQQTEVQKTGAGPLVNGS